NLLERMLGRKRLREVILVLLVMVGALPQFMIVTGSARPLFRQMFSENSSVLWPWEAAARIALGGPAAAAWVALLAATALAYLFRRWQFESNLRFDAQAAQATTLSASAFAEESWSARLFRAPSLLLPDPVGAIVEKELRTLSRTPRFRLVFIMGFTFGIVVW